ncbi:MAG TPA: hypothetical protein VFY93_08470 [Planctomycetota bacterium]|nr:hypothetical protein [Planctomycetota bacterium]
MADQGETIASAQASRGEPQGPPRPTAFWHVLTGIWILLSLPVCASLSPHPVLGMIAFGIGGILGLAWAIQLQRVIADTDARRRMTRRAAVGWAIYPVAALLLALLLTTGVLVLLRVRLSETALERLAGEVASGAEVKDRWAGLMWIESASGSGNAVLLSTGMTFLYEYGLVYSLDGKPPALRHHHTRHLHGRWYTYSYSPF